MFHYRFQGFAWASGRMARASMFDTSVSAPSVAEACSKVVRGLECPTNHVEINPDASISIRLTEGGWVRLRVDPYSVASLQ